MFNDASLAASFAKFCQLGGNTLSTTDFTKGKYGALKLEPVGQRTEAENDENDGFGVPVPSRRKKLMASSTRMPLVDSLKPSATARLAEILTEPSGRGDIDESEKLRSADADAAGFTYNPATKTYNLAGGFGISHAVFNRAFPYQRHAMKWMWDLYSNPKHIHGGILGDDMGLGKTFQVTSFVSGALFGGAASTVLIIVPVSLIPIWQQEIAAWIPKAPVVTLHGQSSAKRDSMLYDIKTGGGICITTYGTLVSQLKQITEWEVPPARRDFVPTNRPPFKWDIVVFDEANKIKNNNTQVSKAAGELSAKMKLLLTGTPIQNHLEELWCLFDIACQSQLLKSKREFSVKFGQAIVTAQDRHATDSEREAGDKAMAVLRDVITPYFLRREKSSNPTPMPPLSGGGGMEGATGDGDNVASSPTPKLAPSSSVGSTSSQVMGCPSRKFEMVVWTRLSPIQLMLYEGFLRSEEVKQMLSSTESPLAAITVLKKICCHPLLLNDRARQATKAALKNSTDLMEEAGKTGLLGELDSGFEAFRSFGKPSEDSVQKLLNHSGKLVFLMQLLESFEVEGHRALVFSQSKVMLDIIQAVLSYRRITYERIDGDVTKTADRQAIVNRFNTTPSIRVCLLTTGVGAYGLTLTGADRVIVMDPSWNPAVDAQAVDRAYRIGQTKDVITYRLITCGTIEEKMYRLQVFKGGLTKSVMAAKNQHCYMTKKELKQMFVLGDHREPETKAILMESLGEALFLSKDCKQPDFSPEIAAHCNWLVENMGLASSWYAEIARHDKLFEMAVKEGQAVPTPFAKKKRLTLKPKKGRRLISSDSDSDSVNDSDGSSSSSESDSDTDEDSDASDDDDGVPVASRGVGDAKGSTSDEEKEFELDNDAVSVGGAGGDRDDGGYDGIDTPFPTVSKYMSRGRRVVFDSDDESDDDDNSDRKADNEPSTAQVDVDYEMSPVKQERLQFDDHLVDSHFNEPSQHCYSPPPLVTAPTVKQEFVDVASPEVTIPVPTAVKLEWEPVETNVNVIVSPHEYPTVKEELHESSGGVQDTNDDVNNVKPSACPEHISAVEAQGFTCLACRCHLDDDDIDKYNDALQAGMAAKSKATTPKDWQKAMRLLLDAVEICSDDIRLHRAIVSVSRKLAC